MREEIKKVIIRYVCVLRDKLFTSSAMALPLSISLFTMSKFRTYWKVYIEKLIRKDAIKIMREYLRPTKGSVRKLSQREINKLFVIFLCITPRKDLSLLWNPLAKKPCRSKYQYKYEDGKGKGILILGRYITCAEGLNKAQDKSA